MRVWREEGLRDLRFRTADLGDVLVSVEMDVSALIRGETVVVSNSESVGQWVSARRVGFAGSRFYVGFPLARRGDPPEISTTHLRARGTGAQCYRDS